MKVLDRYLVARFAAIYIGTLTAFGTLFIVIDAVSNVDDFMEQTDGAGAVLAAMARCYAAMLPVVYCEILGPVVSVCAAMFTVTTSQRANEFVPILASGRSYQRTLMPIVVASLGVSVFVFLVQELWIPRTADVLRETSIQRKGHQTYEDFTWHDGEYGLLIAIEKYERESKTATGVLVFPGFLGRHAPSDEVITAAEMSWIETGLGKGYWLLRRGGVQRLDARKQWMLLAPASGDGAAVLRQPFDERKLDTSLIPEELELGREETVTMPLGVVWRKAEGSLDATTWRIRLLTRFTRPLANLVLVLLGLPIVVYFGGRNIFIGAMLAVTVSTVYFGMDAFLGQSGIHGVLPARVAATLAPAIFIALGATLYRGMRS